MALGGQVQYQHVRLKQMLQRLTIFHRSLRQPYPSSSLGLPKVVRNRGLGERAQHRDPARWEP